MMLLCSLIVTLLTGRASSQTYVYGQEACNQFCLEKRYKVGDWVGTAPYCNAGCSTITCPGACTTGTDKYRISSGCFIGSRHCCCRDEMIDCVGGWDDGCKESNACFETFWISRSASNGGNACEANHLQQRLCPGQDPSCLDDETPAPTPYGKEPTDSPTESPTDSPTESPTDSPTESPTGTPTGTPTQTPTGTPTQTPTGTPNAAAIDTMAKLLAFCDASPANCETCRGSFTGSSCNTRPLVVAKCRKFKGNPVCDRIVGCKSKINKKGKKKCKGKKHGLA